MDKSGISGNFLHIALMETRRIRLETESLEDELRRMNTNDEEDEEHEFKLSGHDLSFRLPGSDLFPDFNIFTDRDYMDVVIKQHSNYYTYLEKNSWIHNVIPGSYIASYYSAIVEFERKIQELFPDLRVLS